MVMEYYIEQPSDDTGVKKLFYFSKKTYTVLFWSKDTLFKNTKKVSEHVTQGLVHQKNTTDGRKVPLTE